MRWAPRAGLGKRACSSTRSVAPTAARAPASGSFTRRATSGRKSTGAHSSTAASGNLASTACRAWPSGVMAGLRLGYRIPSRIAVGPASQRRRPPVAPIHRRRAAHSRSGARSDNAARARRRQEQGRARACSMSSTARRPAACS